MSAAHDAIIIGGGFYGCVLALELRRASGLRVAIVEAGPDLLQRASLVNQARVHNGYHYPRSLLTGLRSRVNFDRFVDAFRGCIVDDFDKYYAIGQSFSKVTAAQFKLFCQRIKAPVEDAPREVTRLFNPSLIEHVFRVRELAFDAEKLKQQMAAELEACGVDVYLRTEATRIEQRSGGQLGVTVIANGEPRELACARVFNCTYARLNQVLAASGLPLIPLKHELTEMALVEMPPSLSKLGITVMCGPFFSVMPFPSRGLHSLSHVRYTPHCSWKDGELGDYRDPYRLFERLEKKTRVLEMVKDARRYVPLLGECRYVDSLWEVKTVLPRSEFDDSRPILFKRDYGLPGLTCIMGSKIDNVFDMVEFAGGGVADT